VEWFGKRGDKSQQAATPDDSIDTVREHLEAIGMSRLRVQNANMKVLLTQIAWHGEEYLVTTSTGGQPSGGQIVDLCKQLEVVRKVVEAFILLEQSPGTSDDYLRQRGEALSSVEEFAVAMLSKLSKAKASGAGSIGFEVDTELLRRLAQQIQ